MRRLRRILAIVVVTVAAILASIYWAAPIALSFYAARKAPAIVRVLPAELKDHSISPAVGTRVSYLGYDFELPWDDLDRSQTEFFPKDKPDKTMARLHFRSGLKIVIIAGPPHSFADQLTKSEIKMSPQAFSAVFGADAMASDYEFMKRVFEFSPDKMHYWADSPAIRSRQEVLLMIKSIIPATSAETGIFNVQNATFQGFQQGNPEIQQDSLLLDLYSLGGGFDIIFLQKNYAGSPRVTQPEINRIVQSLHQAAPAGPVAAQTGKS